MKMAEAVGESERRIGYQLTSPGSYPPEDDGWGNYILRAPVRMIVEPGEERVLDFGVSIHLPLGIVGQTTDLESGITTGMDSHGLTMKSTRPSDQWSSIRLSGLYHPIGTFKNDTRDAVTIEQGTRLAKMRFFNLASTKGLVMIKPTWRGGSVINRLEDDDY